MSTRHITRGKARDGQEVLIAKAAGKEAILGNLGVKSCRKLRTPSSRIWRCVVTYQSIRRHRQQTAIIVFIHVTHVKLFKEMLVRRVNSLQPAGAHWRDFVEGLWMNILSFGREAKYKGSGLIMFCEINKFSQKYKVFKIITGIHLNTPDFIPIMCLP